MPGYRPISNRCLLWAAVLVLVLDLSGCASAPQKKSATPNEGALAPARQALSKARNAHADDFAPRDIDAARQRITMARDILFTAANADRNLTEAEHRRIQQLVDGAKLDARTALVQTQAKAVAVKIAQLESQLSPQPAPAATPKPKPLAAARGTPLNRQPQSRQSSIMDRQPRRQPQPPPGPQRTPPVTQGNSGSGAPGPGGPLGPVGAPPGIHPLGAP